MTLWNLVRQSPLPLAPPCVPKAAKPPQGPCRFVPTVMSTPPMTVSWMPYQPWRLYRDHRVSPTKPRPASMLQAVPRSLTIAAMSSSPPRVMAQSAAPILFYQAPLALATPMPPPSIRPQIRSTSMAPPSRAKPSSSGLASMPAASRTSLAALLTAR